MSVSKRAAAKGYPHVPTAAEARRIAEAAADRYVAARREGRPADGPRADFDGAMKVLGRLDVGAYDDLHRATARRITEAVTSDPGPAKRQANLFGGDR